MGKVLSFWTPAISAGVTTSALMAALNLSKSHSVCVLDLDFNSPDTSLYLNILDAEHNFDNLIPAIEGRNFTEEVFTMNLVAYEKFSLLQGTKKIDKAPLFDSSFIEPVIEMAKKLFDIVIINTSSALDNPGTFLALKNADKVVMVVEQNAHHLKKYIEKSQIVSQIISNPVILINKYDKKILLSDEAIEEYFGSEPSKLNVLDFSDHINQINENKEFKNIFLTKKTEAALDQFTERLLVEIGLKEDLEVAKKKSIFFKK